MDVDGYGKSAETRSQQSPAWVENQESSQEASIKTEPRANTAWTRAIKDEV